jgi:renalase
MTKIAIIGAGISGLTLAHDLKSVAKVVCFEKSRGVGGRMATRRGGGFEFDHGTQFFKARNTLFQQWLESFKESGVVKDWPARFVEINQDTVCAERSWSNLDKHFVACPSMSALAKNLAKDIHIQANTKVEAIKKQRQWQLFDQAHSLLGEFDWVITTAPAPQSAALMPKEFAFHDHIKPSIMQSCFSLMLGFSQPLELSFDAALINGMDISWISVNSSKPDRPNNFTLLVNSTNKWATENFDAHIEQVKNHLIKQTKFVLDQDLENLTHIDCHGWRYANCAKQPSSLALVDNKQKLAACGDWCIHGRVEAAFLSAKQTALEIKQAIGRE